MENLRRGPAVREGRIGPYVLRSAAPRPSRDRIHQAVHLPESRNALGLELVKDASLAASRLCLASTEVARHVGGDARSNGSRSSTRRSA